MRAGVFWWAWDASNNATSMCTTSFEVLNKPAQQVLTTNYLPNHDGSAVHSGPIGMVPMNAHMAAVPASSTAVTVYSDGQLNGWDNWSYSSTVNLQETAHVFPGHTYSLGVALDSYGAFCLHNASFDLTPFTAFSFDIVVPTANASISSYLTLTFCPCDNCQACELVSVALVDYLNNSCTLSPSWATPMSIPLADLAKYPNGTTVTQINRFNIEFNTNIGNNVADFYIDNIVFA
jgi:hypothetical protein